MAEEFQQLLTLVSDVFAGRHDVWAEAYPHPRKPWKMSYAKRLEPLTNQVLADHLHGKHRIGIYPLVDNYVRWFAVDFDAPEDDQGKPVEGAFQIAWNDAEAQAQVFEEAGLFVYLERSRSGDGVHLWGFFDEFVEAATVLRALKPLLNKPESYDRMYPVQAQVEEGGYGNLIALPFHGGSLLEGKSAFLNRDTLEPIDPIAFLMGIQFNNRYVLEELAEKAPREVVQELVRLERRNGGGMAEDFQGRPARPIRGVLKLISEYGCKFMHDFVTNPKGRTQSSWWVAVGQMTCFQNGRDAAHLISALSPKYDPKETDDLYDRISQEVPHGCAYIHANFPEKACTGCPMKAPYHVATKPILQLAQETTQALEKQDWKAAAARVRRRNAGTEPTGIAWGLPGLDSYTRLRRAEFIVIGARPSVGKTAFMVDRAVDIARRGIPVFVFSAETGKTGLQDRVLANVAGIDSKLLRGEGMRPLTEDEYARLDAAVTELESLPLYINYSATRADQILDLIEETILVNRIPLNQEYVVFQDYIQFGTPGDGASEEYGRVSKVSAEFKFVAKILNNVFVAFSQLKRDSEGEEKPDLDAFKNSGRIEEAADVAMVLSGERVSGPTAPRWMHNLKQREGEVGWSIRMKLHQAVSQFETVEAPPPPETKDLFASKPDVSAELGEG